MPRVVYSLRARDDLASIYEYVSVEASSRTVGRRVTTRIRQHCEHIASLPGVLGTLRADLHEGLRSTPSGAYLIFFRYLPDALEIVRIVRGERRLEDLSYNADDPRH